MGNARTAQIIRDVKMMEESVEPTAVDRASKSKSMENAELLLVRTGNASTA